MPFACFLCLNFGERPAVLYALPDAGPFPLIPPSAFSGTVFLLYKLLHRSDAFSNRTGGEALQKELSITAGMDAPVQDAENAPVIPAADEPAKPLAQGDNRLRHLIAQERVFPCLR